MVGISLHNYDACYRSPGMMYPSKEESMEHLLLQWGGGGGWKMVRESSTWSKMDQTGSKVLEK